MLFMEPEGRFMVEIAFQKQNTIQALFQVSFTAGAAPLAYISRIGLQGSTTDDPNETMHEA